MMGRAARRFRALMKRKPPKPKKEEGPRLKCRGCGERMSNSRPPKRARDTEYHTHIMCPCGTVSHWYPTIVMILVGWGRFRINTSVPVPHYLLDTDVLWLCPNTNTVYFFKPNHLCRFTLRDLPPIKSGHYQFILLAKGRKIRLDSKYYEYDGFSFVPYDSSRFDFPLVSGNHTVHLSVETSYLVDETNHDR